MFGVFIFFKDIFKKYEHTQYKQFFHNQPQKPKINEDILFYFQKTFFRNDDSESKWLIYNKNPRSLFCYLCLAFSSQSNPFTKGLDIWSRTYIRMDEHKKSKIHNNCVTAIFTILTNLILVHYSSLKLKTK